MRNFDHTVNVLVKAYLNGTLEHGNYCSCAVGNIIADSIGAQLVLKDNRLISKYRWLHPDYNGSEWFLKMNGASDMIAKSGYTDQEIWRIEKTFEGARRCGYEDDEDRFRGLMAVVDVLAEIHGVDLEVKESAKLLFVK